MKFTKEQIRAVVHYLMVSKEVHDNRVYGWGHCDLGAPERAAGEMRKVLPEHIAHRIVSQRERLYDVLVMCGDTFKNTEMMLVEVL